MKNFKIFFIIIFTLYFDLTNSQVQFEFLSVDDFINKMKDIQYKTEDYNNIIKHIRESLSKYYVYYDISKSTLLNVEPVDFDKKLESINTQNTTFLDFYNSLFNVISSVKDLHLNVAFINIIKNYTYFLPIIFNVKTDKETDTNYLYYSITKDNSIKRTYNTTYLNLLKQYEYVKIKSINKKDPFNYILKFQNTIKDEHAQFSSNLRTISIGKIQNFTKTNFDILNIEFERNQTIQVEYKVVYIKFQTKKFQSYYEEKMENYLESYNKPSIFEIIQQYNYEKGKEERNLQSSIWDENYQNIIKYKIDNDKQVNVIYHSSFEFKDKLSSIAFFGKMMEKFSTNNYSIIVIESLNAGGVIKYSSIFQKALNYNSGMSKSIMSFRYSEKNLDFLNKEYIINIGNCKREKLMSDNLIYEDNFNNVIFKRTKFFYTFNLYEPQFLLKDYKHKDRKPTNILIFTDGYSFSATSYFIKDLQESGNAIIVGYNGIPSNEKKRIKFNGSQSPSSVVILDVLFPKDENVIILKTKYNIRIGCTFGASYDHSYQNKSKLHFPREYTINPIDERSLIYGSYDDSRYLEFVNEGKNIIEKYTTKCNPDNLNLLLKNDSCKFGNSFIHGGMECSKNGYWGNECKPYYCDSGYYFDTYEKICKKDKCKSTYENSNLLMFIIISIIIVVLLICLSIIGCYYCYSRKKEISSIDIGTLLPS